MGIPASLREAVCQTLVLEYRGSVCLAVRSIVHVMRFLHKPMVWVHANLY
jgi:hypothetical protein